MPMAPIMKHKFQYLMPPLCLFLLSLCAHPAHSQGHSSARIYSLGGSSVSGIIPDFYTDLAINPAYASLADTITLNYGYRSIPQKKLPFHYMNRNFYFGFPSTSSYSTNELLAYGIKLSGWRFSIASEWYLDNDEHTNTTVNQTYSSYNDTHRNEISAKHNENDNNYLHFALSAARALGGENSIGVRVGGTEYYYSGSYNRNAFLKYYKRSDTSGETYLSDDDSDYYTESNTTRWISIYTQIGLIMGNDPGKNSEIVLKIARSPIYSRRNYYDLDISYDYESTSELRRYDYYLTEWVDRKECNLWTVALSGRHTFPDDVKIYLGGAYETSSYESDWLKMYRDYNWYSYTTDTRQYMTFSTEGDFKRFFLFAKAGKTYNVLKKLDITVGLKSFFERYSNSENPLVHFNMNSVDDQVYREIETARMAQFEFDNTRIQFLVPLALEYKPLDYFSCFAGFSCDIVWSRNTEEFTFPIFFDDSDDSDTFFQKGSGFYGNGIGSGYYGHPINNCRDNIKISDAATVGFSLNYKNRFFIDLYTGSDITPDYISNMIIDARYKF